MASWLRELPAVAVLAFALLGLYLFTAPSTVTLEDSGEMILVASELGIAHPPGYPVYTFLGWLFTKLPVGTLAFRVHMLSAIAAVTACVATYAIGLMLTSRRLAALTAAGLLGVSSTFWWQAIVAEVYALHAALFFVTFAFALHAHRTGRPSSVSAAVLMWGVGLGHHWPLLVLATPSLAVLLWRPVVRERRVGWPRLVAFAALGLLPYAHLLIASATGPQIATLGPIESLWELVAYVSREHYDDTAAVAVASDKLVFMARFFGGLATEMTPPVAVIAVLGFGLIAKRRPPAETVALLAAFASSGVVLPLILGREPNPLQSEVFEVYQLVPIGVMSICAAFALARLFEGRFAIAGLACVAVAATANWDDNDLRADTAAFDHAQAILEAMPQGAVLFAGTDLTLGPLAYAHRVGTRPDVRLRSEYGLFFDNRVMRPGDSDLQPSVDLAKRVLAERGRFFATERGPLLDALGATITDYGPYLEVRPRGLAPGGPRPNMIAHARTFLDRSLDGTYKRRWSWYRGVIRRQLCTLLTLAEVHHPAFEQDRQCRWGRARVLPLVGGREEAARILASLIEDPPPMGRAERAVLSSDYLVSQAREAGADLGRLQRVADRVAPALADWPSCHNPLRRQIERLRREHGVEVAVPVGLPECPPDEELHGQRRKTPPVSVH